MSEMMNQLEPGRVQPSDTELLQVCVRFATKEQLYSVCLNMQGRLLKLIPVASDEKLMEELLVLNDELNGAFARYNGYASPSGQSRAHTLNSTYTNLVDLGPVPQALHQQEHAAVSTQQLEGRSAISMLSHQMTSLSAGHDDGRAVFTQAGNGSLPKRTESVRYIVPDERTGERLAEGRDSSVRNSGADDTQESTVLGSSPNFDWMVAKGMVEFDRFLEERAKAGERLPPLSGAVLDTGRPQQQPHDQLFTR
ncbi:hypothetical protein Z043_105127 [Scleropages formosus]|uniref:GAT domain-containing protein n=1 Tax=Scleropages formosus TaxID=113540 RepID=A0A0P7XKQ6_SCLFO|nr:hypothetical protein Z043_105127 [Scleropages formosus]